MRKHGKLIEKYENSDFDDKLNFLFSFNGELDEELSVFFLSIFIDESQDIELRCEAVKILGLYRGVYEDENIKEKIIEVIMTEGADDEVQVSAINALSMIINDNDDLFIKKIYEIILGNYYSLVKEAAFSLIVEHKNLDVSQKLLSKLVNNNEFGFSAKRELSCDNKNK
ncbi:hypothetical protein [Morganella morganii]|uniref:hypothetical protein n=1 Tax=Morganella morganii TaxID=582 RepID=UPI001C44C0B8|nr:hypothetical protein [Morganella morganii]QXO66635.1 HEAT repeat domain-containing protein [Morganella morganii]